MTQQRTQPISVLIADDQQPVRDGLATLIESQHDMIAIGKVGDGQRAIEFVRRWAPDVVLMDIRMPGLDGIEATREIVSRNDSARPTRVVILTTYDLDEYVFDALQAGATGFLLKHTPPELLLTGIRAAADGAALVSAAVTLHLIEAFSATHTRPARSSAAEIERLSTREREVFDLVAAGHTNAAIAAELQIGDSTVKTHLNRILSKLNLRDRVHAVIYAYEHHLVEH
ncbi:MAG: response regulator [Ilumatobacteraceae bacterium]